MAGKTQDWIGSTCTPKWITNPAFVRTTFAKYLFWRYICTYIQQGAPAPVQQKNKKYDLKFKFSVVKSAEVNSGEAATRYFSVDPKNVRDWRKNQAELQRLSEEDSSRARMPAGGRRTASEEPEINMRG